MVNQQTGTKYNPNAEVHVILGGIMGREKVIQALFKDTGVKMEKVEVPGYGLRIQQIADINPKEVREDMATVWQNQPYMGAVGVVASPGETVQATRITTTITKWKEANKLIRKFNYHEYGENTANSWFHNEGVTLPQHEGKVDIIEAFADKNGLKKIEEVYDDPGKFEEDIAKLEPIMAASIEEFRRNVLEGNATGSEQKE